MAIDPKITIAEIADYLKLTVQAIHKRMQIAGLKQKRNQSRIYFGHDTARKIICPTLAPLKLAMAVVKGGVGKTTLSEALAIRACIYGLRVLCIDVDQQANLTKGLQMDEVAKNSPVMIDLVEGKADAVDSILNVIPGLDLVPSRLDNVTLDGYLMVNRHNPQTVFNKIFCNIYKNYDLIIFDCPPTLGVTVCASMLASDLIIAPLNPDVYSYEGIKIMDKEIKNIHQQFGKEITWKILLNKFDSKTILSTDYITQLIKDPKFSEKLLKTVIRTSQEFPDAKKKNKCIFDTLKKSAAKEDIDSLAREILGLMEVMPANNENDPLFLKNRTRNNSAKFISEQKRAWDFVFEKQDIESTSNKNEEEKINRGQDDKKLKSNWSQTRAKPESNWKQTDNKPITKFNFSSLVGLQRSLVIFIYNECNNARSKSTKNLTLEYISKTLNSSAGCIKTTLQRLELKGFIERIEYKNGRGGWSKYSIPDQLFQKILQYETGNKPYTNLTQTSHKPHTNLTQTLHKPHTNLTQTLHKPYTNLTQYLTQLLLVVVVYIKILLLTKLRVRPWEI